MPYLPYNPKPKPPPPYVPPAPVMVILAPTAGQTVTDPTPTLRGTAPAAGTVTVVIRQGSTVVQTLTPTAASGTWVATAATLADNNYTVTATQTVSGSPVTSGPSAFTVDAVATPPTSVIIMSPAAGATVQDDTPPIVGSAPGGTTVTVTIHQGTTLLQTLTATPSGGTWQVTATSLADGVYQIGASQVGAGNATPVTFTMDVPQPAVTISSVAGGPPGSSTNDTTPAINGTGQNRAGDATTVDVTVRQGATVVQTHTGVPLVGTVWSKTLTTALAVGSYQVRATQASSFGAGTSSDFPFTVTAAAALPAPTISGPTEGQTLAGNPIAFTGTAGAAAGDSTMLTVRVYPAGSSTATASQAVTRSGGSWSLSFTATISNGSWQARVEQGGTAGVGVSALRQFSMAIPSSAPGLAMPRGPVNGFAGAADFYDSVGVCHHPQYFNNGLVSDPATDAAIGAMQQLGVRHVRLGLDSPASHGNFWRMQEFLIRERAIRGANQPIHALWGTPGGPPAQRRNQGYEIYTATNTNGTFLRPLDGPPGTVPTENWTAAEGGGKKYSAGTFYDIGWESAAGLQGSNEPTLGYENGFESHRWWLNHLKLGKNARTGETVLSGGSYVDYNTGRIVAGSAKAPQIPVVAPSIVSGDWAVWGDYTNRVDVDTGCMHLYWGGHSPIYLEAWDTTSANQPGMGQPSNWYRAQGFNGRLAGGMGVNALPVFVTETGYMMRSAGTGYDGAPGQVRHVAPDVGGEYLIRTLLQNYMTGVVKRTYLFSLHDVGEGNVSGGGRHGLCGSLTGPYSTSFGQRASFHAIKNLLSIVGFRQATNPVPITVPVTYTNGPSQSMPSKTIVDRLDARPILQTADNEYLIFFVRQSQVWDRDAQAYMTPTARNATFTLPSGTWTCSVCEPAKNPVGCPENPTSDPSVIDGQTYANPQDGTAFAAAGTAGNGFTMAGNTGTLRMAGLTRVVKAVRATGGDALHARVVSELNEFANWTTSNAVQGAVTEFGVPGNKYATGTNAYIAADEDEWAGLLEAFYARCQVTNLHTLQWGASEAFRAYELAPYVGPGVGSALNEANANAGPLEAHANDALMYRGVALTGLEFGTGAGFSNTNPGALHSNYFAATLGSWTYIRSKGVKVARVGFRWERLQPTLGGALNGTYLNEISTQVARANTAGVDVVLDCHNYGGYITSSGQLKLGSAGLTSAHFNDLWSRLAQVFASNARVVGYEIMNEPEGMPLGASGWRTQSQSCVNAIRAVDATTAIWVGGYNWSKVQGWVATNGATPWITGSNIVYVAHQYFDTESSLNLGGPAADSGYAQPYASAVADSNTAFSPPLAVSGSRIVDATGDPKLLRGGNMMSQEWDGNMTNEVAGIPVLSSNWNGNIVTKGFASGPVNSGNATYLAQLDQYVSLTLANQCYMAFVYRTPLQNGDPQPELPDAAATQALTALAARYKTSPHVIFGLQVEPHGASATWTAMRPLFESMVDSIRGASGSNNANFPLILVPGYDWSRNLSGVISNPVARPNVVYKTHPYNASSQFQGLFGTAHDAGLPVFVGEFAPNVDMAQADVAALLAFTRARQIGWAAWLFDTRTENLLTSWSGTPSSPYGVSVRDEMLLTP